MFYTFTGVLPSFLYMRWTYLRGKGLSGAQVGQETGILEEHGENTADPEVRGMEGTPGYHV